MVSNFDKSAQLADFFGCSACKHGQWCSERLTLCPIRVTVQSSYMSSSWDSDRPTGPQGVLDLMVLGCLAVIPVILDNQRNS